MIATCTNCGDLFETTGEDAFTPGVLCRDCFLDGIEQGWASLATEARREREAEQAQADRPDPPPAGGDEIPY
jgi:predicted  nucleic acid-binding Zn-ribbon protein